MDGWMERGGSGPCLPPLPSAPAKSEKQHIELITITEEGV